jgi:glycine/D-amino acid oxidase-like deaminating enzyme
MAGRWPAPVRADSDRLIRTVVGLRPYRPSGFVVRGERLGDKVVIHNYGHGGAGITLSWGTAELAVREAARTEQREVAVLGCGAVGLATARLLQRRGWDVTIYARDLPPRTTSNVAGGLWSPTSVAAPDRLVGAFGEAFREASELAHRAFQDLPGERFGIRWRDNYLFGDSPPSAPYWVSQVPHLYPGMQSLGPGDHPFPVPHALHYRAMVIEPPIYLRQMLLDFRAAGGSLVVRALGSVEEVLALPEPVVLNCTGLGARDLFGDQELTPVKGQLHVLEPQPEVDYVTLNGGLYMIPRADGVLLGGTFERGEWSLEPDPAARGRILDGHARFFGGMTGP